jgi:hypothetical protein
VKTARMDELPGTVEGWAVSLCNGAFLKSGVAADMKRRGARIAWSNEMMWHFEGELQGIQSGLIDRILFVSPAQREALEPGYREVCGALASDCAADEIRGSIPRLHAPPLPWVMTGNWIDPGAFPFRCRGLDHSRPFTVGRLSRPDPDKFPDNFPATYEGLGLQEPVRFRVMGWSETLRDRWCEHEFDERWELLAPNAEPAAAFLNSLDVFLYGLSPRFCESWGRAIVEAMLTGAVPVVPRGGGHHIERLLKHGVSGFLYETASNASTYTRMLRNDPGLLRALSQAAHDHAVGIHCRAESHLALWRSVFD